MAAPMSMRWAATLRTKCSFSRRFKALGGRLMGTSTESDRATEDNACAGTTSDPRAKFLDPHVQDILYKITGFDLDHIFKVKPLADLAAPQYKLLTNKQLEEVQEAANERGRKRLQMPPFMAPRQEKLQVISDDPEIEGHDTCKYVFTDITFGLKGRAQTMVVREPSGLLRSTSQEERDRIEHVYFPKPGRMFRIPRMFEPNRLEVLLGQDKYEYILDRACVQFEPDDPEYIRVTHRTYEHVESARKYDLLYSTRHFGVMAFYLILYKKVDGLIVDRIQHDMLTDAADVVRLYHMVHPDCQSAVVARDQNLEADLDLIKLFAGKEGSAGSLIELALQTYRESNEGNSA